MQVLITRSFGTLKSVTHTAPEITPDWRDELAGLSGFIDVHEAPHDQQLIVCEFYGFLNSIRVFKPPCTVEILNCRLTAWSHNTMNRYENVNQTEHIEK